MGRVAATAAIREFAAAPVALLRYPAAVRLPVRPRASLCIYTTSWRGERVVLGASGAIGRVNTVCAGTEECVVSAASAGVVAFVVASCASALAVRLALWRNYSLFFAFCYSAARGPAARKVCNFGRSHPAFLPARRWLLDAGRWLDLP